MQIIYTDKLEKGKTVILIEEDVLLIGTKGTNKAFNAKIKEVS